jgi:hypothetical protein
MAEVKPPVPHCDEGVKGGRKKSRKKSKTPRARRMLLDLLCTFCPEQSMCSRQRPARGCGKRERKGCPTQDCCWLFFC